MINLSKKNLFLVFILSFYIQHGHSQSGSEITREMIAATKEIKTLTYTMKKTERVNGAMGKPQIASIKLTRSPFRIYIRQRSPNDGLEVLYTEGTDQALINPNGFPWFNISLDPLGERMRKEQHHTILESGYDHFVSILEHLFNKYGNEIDHLTTVRSISHNERPCWVVEFKNPYFTYADYVAKEGETVSSIAKKLKVNGYMILQVNENISDYSQVVAGQTITVPTDYSSRMTLIIDKEMMLPIVMEIYDDKGLYEIYEYSKITVNPRIQPEEFSEAYPDYGF